MNMEMLDPIISSTVARCRKYGRLGLPWDVAEHLIYEASCEQHLCVSPLILKYQEGQYEKKLNDMVAAAVNAMPPTRNGGRDGYD